MAWESAPPPNYPTLNPQYLGNAIANLFNNYQQAQQGQQRTQANDLRNQQDQMLLNQQKAFAGGVPMNPDGTPNYSAIMKTLAEKGDINAIGSLAPIIQQEQNIQGANAPDPFFGGGSGSGGYAQPSTPAPGPWSSNPFLSTVVGAESEGNNSDVGDNGQAKGDFQFHDATWQKYAKNVPGASQYASAADAPPDVQQAVAETAPISEWGPRTKAILHAKFGPFDESQTIGQLATEFGGGKGTEVASLGDSDVTAYATPETPAIPPASASAGSTIPRGNDRHGTLENETGPSRPSQQWTSGPAWAGINASLPVGGARLPAVGARSQSPAAPASAPGQGSVASIVSGAVGDPQRAALVARNIGQLMGVDPGAALTPAQADRVKKGVRAYVARTGQQATTGGQGQPSAGGPLVPQFPLPAGFKDPQQAILAIDQDIARLSRFGPAATGRIRALEDMRDRIAKSSAPIAMHAGEMLVNPATGQTIARVPYANANTMALQAFMEEHPNATAEDIQAFMAAGRGGRGGVTQAKASDIAKAIESGDQPPVLTGLYGASGLVRSKLAEDGFDLSKHQMEWDAAKKMVLSLNGPQMVRFMGLANSVQNTMSEVDERADEMKNSGIPLMNAARMTAYIQAEGNSEKGQLATRYMEATNALKEELASLVQGGYVPTEAAWKLSNEMVNANYGSEQMTAGLDELQRLIKYRLKAFPGMSEIGPGSANQYIPGGGQTSSPPPATGASSSGPRASGGAHPPGTYNYDPASGNLEPVK